MSNAKDRRQSPRLPPPIRRRQRNCAQGLRRPARPPLPFPQSQHFRLNDRGVRVSRRKRRLRQARCRHPRHERRPRQSPSLLQGQTKTQFPVAQRPHPQNHPKIRRLAEKTIHGPHLHGHRSQLLPNRQNRQNRRSLAPRQSQGPPRRSTEASNGKQRLRPPPILGVHSPFPF